MKRSTLTIGVVASLMAFAASQTYLPGAHAQGAAGVVKVDDFESGLGGWTAIKAGEGIGFGVDEGAKLSIATEAQQPKVGKGALVYTYEVQPKILSALLLNRETDLTGMKSLRFWARTSSPTSLVVSITEKNGAAYMGSFYCDAGDWTEQVMNLDEFSLDDPAKETNDKLDLDQIASIAVFDMNTMLVNLIPELKGSRTLSLDEILFSAQGTAQTTGTGKNAAGKPAYLIDTFENRSIRWTPLSVDVNAGLKINAFDLPLRIDSDVPNGGGKASLQTSYTRMAGRLPVLMRDLEKVKLGAPTALSLSIKTGRDGNFLIGLEEKDGSRYQQTVELKAGDLWKDLRLTLNTFTLDNDSQDENGKLDASQIKQITIVDMSGLLGADLGGANTLYIDQISFDLSD